MKVNIVIFTSRSLVFIHELRFLYWQLRYHGTRGFQKTYEVANYEIIDI